MTKDKSGLVVHTTVSALAGAPSDLILTMRRYSARFDVVGLSFGGNRNSGMYRGFIPAEQAYPRDASGSMSLLAEFLADVSILHIHNIVPHEIVEAFAMLRSVERP